jgi:hypothetical protein
MFPQKIAMVSCALVGLVASFLPWASLGARSVSGIDGSAGWINFALFLAALVVSGANGRLFRSISVRAVLGAGIPSALASANGVWMLVRVSERHLPEPGLALYAIVAGGLLLPVLGLVLRRPPVDPVEAL